MARARDARLLGITHAVVSGRHERPHILKRQTLVGLRDRILPIRQLSSRMGSFHGNFSSLSASEVTARNSPGVVAAALASNRSQTDSRAAHGRRQCPLKAVIPQPLL